MGVIALARPVASPPRMFRSALAHRDLRLLYAGMTVSMAGYWAYNVALLAVVYDRTGSLGWVAAATVGRFVPSIAFSPYAGVLADRFEQVRVMVASNLVAGASQAALAVTALATGPVPLIIVLAGSMGAEATAVTPAMAAVVPRVVDEDDLAAANALRGVIENVVQVAAPAAGALILVVLPAWSVFAFDAATYVAAATQPSEPVRS